MKCTWREACKAADYVLEHFGDRRRDRGIWVWYCQRIGLGAFRKPVTLVEAIPEPPEPIAESSDGHVKVMSVRPTTGGTLTSESGITLTGSGLGRDGDIGITDVSGDIEDSTEWRIASQSDGKIDVVMNSTATPPGTYDFELVLAYSKADSEWEELRIPLTIQVV